jgi:hypothetical protein
METILVEGGVPSGIERVVTMDGPTGPVSLEHPTVNKVKVTHNNA